MRSYTRILAVCLLFAALVGLAACDVPPPPPEVPTPTAGSSNPESEQARIGVVPVLPTAEHELTPVAGGAGRIYFLRDGRLWVISPDGTGERQISDLTITSPPMPSPDGNSVAVVAGQDLYVVPSSGGSPRKVTSGDMVDRQRVGWSPDGKLLGYTTYDRSTAGQEQSWSVDAAGGQPTLITSMINDSGRGATYERMVKWSPDNKWVIVGGAVSPMRLLRWPLSNTREGDVRDLPGGEPDWSPDSRTLVYTESLDGALETYDVLDATSSPFRNEQQSVGTGLGEYSWGPAPMWTPASYGGDADEIAYRSHSPEGAIRVAIRRRDNIELNTLPDLTSNPSWSPAGDRLVVETGYMEDDPLGPKWFANGLGIASVHPDGTNTFAPLVKNAQWPAWSR